MNGCEACRHPRSYHGADGKGTCDVDGCGCYGFWPNMKAKHCDNPKCKGDCCVEGRRLDGGPAK